MLEAIHKSGDIIFFANGDKIEKHTCMGSFEVEGKMNYVITPYGKLARLNDANVFKTFEEAKEYIVTQAEEVVKRATEQVERIKSITDNVVLHPFAKPTEEEMLAEEKAIAEKTAQEDPKA